MHLGIKPGMFLARLLPALILTYIAWQYLAPYYTRFLGGVVNVAIRGVELSSDRNWHQVTEVWGEGKGIKFWPRVIPRGPQAPTIEADWIQANLVLLIPLILATPALTWGLKFKRVGLGLLIALSLQVLDVILAIKFFYSNQWAPQQFAPWARFFYAMATNFTMTMDAQIFPFMIWAGLHFRQLLGWEHLPTAVAAPAAATVQASKPRRTRAR